MTDLFKLILGILASRFKARATLEAENLVLRQQLNVLHRRTPKRPHLNNTSSGGWRYGRIDDARGIPIAKAVAASAAYPLILPPLMEKFSFVRGDNRTKIDHLFEG
jgi:hypothetical protein